jgi:glycerol-3-phosphate acyltransferase PlsX
MLIALDAMGGEYSPREAVKAAVEAVADYPMDIALVGKKPVLEMLLRKQKGKDRISIVEASEVVEDNEDAIQAVQNKPDSSVAVAARMVKEGKAAGFVSVGSTGAAVVAAFLNLPMVPGIERGALCCVIDVNQPKPICVIDIGINPNCQPLFLVQFAQMGNIFAERVLDIRSPRIGLLNNGEEEKKGNALTKETHQRLKLMEGLNFIGNVEPFEVLRGKADVIVMDGFTGNILVKTIEGYSEIVENLLAMGDIAKIDQYLTGSALVQYTELAATVRRLDYKEVGGGILLGLEGNVVIGHGRSRAKAIKNCIVLCYQAANHNMVEAIKNATYATE